MIDIDELKTNWCLANLKDIALSIQYGYTASAIEESTGVKYLRITDLQNNSVNWNTVPFCKCDIVDKYKLKKGDIVIARTGATTGKSFLLKDIPTTSVFASYLIRLETCDIYLPEYIAMYMQSKSYWQQITVVSKGTAQPGANATILSKLKVPFPPLNEQKRIVAKIEALQTRSTAVKEELEAIKPLLDQFRQSVLAAAFRGDLTKDWREQNPDVEPASRLIASLQTPNPEHHLDIFEQSRYYKLPKSWMWVQLGKLGTLLGGGTPSKRNPSFWDGHIPWVSAKDMKIDRIKDSIDHITEEAISKSSAKIIPKSSILFVVRGMILNHTLPIAITDDVVTINQDMKALVPEIADMSEYLLFACKFVSKQILFKVKSATHGTRRLETSTLKDWAIPIPPFLEQKEIVRRIESLFKLADSIEQQYQQAEIDLETLNQSILAKAFRGELVPQDPNDEPASVLLERIKEERHRAKATAKKSKTKKKSSKEKDKQLGIPGI